MVSVDEADKVEIGQRERERARTTVILLRVLFFNPKSIAVKIPIL